MCVGGGGDGEWVAELNNLCNFGICFYLEFICEIILNLNQCFRTRSLSKIFLILNSGGHFVHWSKTFVQFW